MQRWSGIRTIKTEKNGRFFPSAASVTEFPWNHRKFNKDKRDRLPEKMKAPVFDYPFKPFTLLKLQTGRLTLPKKNLQVFPPLAVL